MKGKGLGYSKKRQKGDESRNAQNRNKSFAEQYLQKLGWKEGSGLGKKKTGIKRAIQITKKHDTKGLGTTTDWSSQWWDHMFDKASASIVIDTGDDGEVVVSSKSKDEQKQIGKELLYGCFVKASSLYVSEM